MANYRKYAKFSYIGLGPMGTSGFSQAIHQAVQPYDGDIADACRDGFFVSPTEYIPASAIVKAQSCGPDGMLNAQAFRPRRPA